MSALAVLPDSGVTSLPPLALERGGILEGGRIAWRIHGDPDLPAVLVMGGISAHRHVADDEHGQRGWWPDLVGPGLALDTDRFRVLGFDWLGGSGASTRAAGLPRNEGPIPAFTPADQAAAVRALLDALGIETLYACVGASYGGMVALALGIHAPPRVRRLIVLGAAHEPHPMATALRSVQRSIVQLGLAHGDGVHALALARGLAMTTYRSAREFASRFDVAARVQPEGFRFDVESYLDYHGHEFTTRFTPDDFLCLSQSIDLHAVDPERVRVPATLVAFEPDAITPAWQVRELARRLGARWTLRVLPSVFGHDAFLKEVAAVGRIVSDALALEVV